MNTTVRKIPSQSSWQRIPFRSLTLIALLASVACTAKAPPDSVWGPQIQPTADPQLETRIQSILERMSLEQKVGQIIQAEIQHATPEDVQRYGLGSVLNGGGSFPGLDRRAALDRWRELAGAYRKASRQPMQEGLPSIPVLWGTDAVHGHSNVFGATLFPHNIGLGATRNSELVRAIAQATAKDVRATGIDWNFAPTIAVARDLRWGRTYESFSSDPDLVTRLGEAAILGLQGNPEDDWLGSGRVLATAKHFVGDGGTRDGVDQGDTRLPEDQLAAIHGRPYRAAMEAGAQTVMASFSSWNGQKMHGHHYLLTEVLKNTLGFDGFVIGDWNGHGQIPGCTVTDCLQALEAGVDMFMVPEDWRELRATLLEHARHGRLATDRLDDAVRRILRVKLRAGLFDRAADEIESTSAQLDRHAELARQAVRESLVLLKNDGGLLPLSPNQRIAVVGDGADDIGKQSGGWTLDWQGVTGTNESFPNGQSIYDGIAKQVHEAGGRAHLGEAGLADFSPDVIIAVFGENPYAEGQGDLETLEFQPGSRKDLDMLDRLAGLKVPVVTVFLSGRPLWVNPHLNRSNAFLAAWLPGTEGGGVADVLLTDTSGQTRHDATGRLPFPWPAGPVPDADGHFPALFEIGFGLSYEDRQDLPVLPEDGMSPRIDASIVKDEVVVFDGYARQPWQLVLVETASGALIEADGQIARTSETGGVVITPTDRHLQGDARRVRWLDSAGDAIALVTDAPADLHALSQMGARLTFDLRLESTAPHPLSLVVDCDPSCRATVALGDALQPLAIGQWHRLGIELACFQAAGADLTRIRRVFELSAGDRAEFSLADVRIEPPARPATDVECPD
ncbi:MAG: glycoside hydrolase family 3 N-terminal domain-containing protein [Xanthomonadaceae bacterium]|nr:glycoside hydrolase family 3 N-terminal domain-containing protein [Xanthomonadaceae bacterium]